MGPLVHQHNQPNDTDNHPDTSAYGTRSKAIASYTIQTTDKKHFDAEEPLLSQVFNKLTNNSGHTTKKIQSEITHKNVIVGCQPLSSPNDSCVTNSILKKYKINTTFDNRIREMNSTLLKSYIKAIHSFTTNICKDLASTPEI